MLYEIIGTPILGGVAGSLATFLFHRVRGRRAMRYVNRFWRFPKGKEVLVVFPKSTMVPDPDTKECLEGRLNMYGAVALAEVNNLLGKLGISARLVASDAKMSEEEKGSNLVLIGGTLGNEVCTEICNKIKDKLDVYWFGELGSADEHHLSNQHGKTFATRISTSATGAKIIQWDHGLVLKFKNPYNPMNWVIVLAGNYGAGTLAVTKAAKNNQILSEVAGRNVDLKKPIGFVVKGCPEDFDVREYSLEGLPFRINQ